MSKLADAFRAAGIHNEHTLTGKGRVYISFTPHQGRSGGGDWWQVHRVGYKNDPNGHWMKHGNRTFVLFSYPAGTHQERKALALQAAKEWAAERYGIPVEAWVPSPFGRSVLVERDLLESRKAEVGYGRKRAAP